MPQCPLLLLATLIISLLGPCAYAQGPEITDGAIVRRLQIAALRNAHLTPNSHRSLQARLRLAALLPHVSVSLGRGAQFSLSETSSEIIGPLRESLSISARWDLGRLLYAPEEGSLLSAMQRSAQARNHLSAEVAKLYFKRQALLRGPATASHQREAAEIGAILEAMTGFQGLIPAIPTGGALAPPSVEPDAE